jgi:hypothetical protein
VRVIAWRHSQAFLSACLSLSCPYTCAFLPRNLPLPNCLPACLPASAGTAAGALLRLDKGAKDVTSQRQLEALSQLETFKNPENMCVPKLNILPRTTSACHMASARASY